MASIKTQEAREKLRNELRPEATTEEQALDLYNRYFVSAQMIAKQSSIKAWNADIYEAYVNMKANHHVMRMLSQDIKREQEVLNQLIKNKTDAETIEKQKQKIDMLKKAKKYAEHEYSVQLKHAQRMFDLEHDRIWSTDPCPQCAEPFKFLLRLFHDFNHTTDEMAFHIAVLGSHTSQAFNGMIQGIFARKNIPEMVAVADQLSKSDELTEDDKNWLHEMKENVIKQHSELMKALHTHASTIRELHDALDRHINQNNNNNNKNPDADNNNNNGNVIKIKP